MSLPIKNAAYTFCIVLIDAANTTQFLVTPTVVAGDVKVSIDFGALNNITAVPTVVNGQVEVQLTAAEMNGDSITVQFEDQTVGPEWLPMRVIIPTI